MSSIDERVVEMKFNNSQFEAGVKTTNQSLSNLKKGLDLSGSTKGLNDLQAAGNRFSLGHIADGVSTVAHRFTAMGVIGATVLSDLTYKAVNAGLNIAKSLTIAPITAGFQNYETQINAVQTILANTQSEGTKLPAVTAALKDLNTYANQTVYNFSDMTKNIGTFTAAGVKLQPAVQSIKGIANLAALSGSNAEQASGAMYQLSQAIAAGTFKLQDYNSVVNAGLGGKVFQKAIIDTARAQGVGVDAIIKKAGSFRAALSTGFVTSKILTQTLAQFTGELSDKQLRAQGFTEKEAQAIIKQGKTAVDAATKIKTLSQLTQALGEEVASAYASLFSTLFGNINEAKSLFSSIHNVAETALTQPIYDFGKALDSWKNLGGRRDLIVALSQAFKFLMAVIKPIHQAFVDIFPPVTGLQLLHLTVAFANFTRSLQVSGTTANLIYRTFKGVFAIFDIGRLIIVGLVKTVFSLFTSFAGGGSSILNVTAAIGDFIVNLRNALKDGNGLTVFFSGLAAVLSIPIRLIGILVGALADLLKSFDHVKGSNAGKAFADIQNKLRPLSVALGVLSAIWTRFTEAFGRLFTAAGPAIAKIADQFDTLGEQIIQALSDQDYSTVLDVINTSLLGGILILVRKFFKNGFKVDVGGGFLGSIKETFEGLTGVLTTMQQNVKANVIIKIAVALALLTASVVALASINSGRLTSATVALTAMFTQLGTAMFLFGKIAIGPSLAKLPVLTSSMILLAVAIDILANAVKKLSSLDIPGLVKGLSGVGVLLGFIAGYAKVMQGSSKGLLLSSLGIIALATGLNILATAVAKLGNLDIGSLSKGLGGVAVALAEIAGFSHIISPKGMITAGVALTILGAALNIMAKAVAAFSAIAGDKLTTGLSAMGIALLTVAGALQLVPGPEAIASAAALVVVSFALGVLATALKAFGDLSLDEIGKGLGTLAASLVIVAASLILMTEALPGAAALVVAAYGLTVLAPALKAFGDLSADEIGKAIGTLAASLVIIAASMILMTEALPGAAALVVVAVALTILAPALAALGSIDIPTIVTALGTMAAAFVILGVAGLLLTPVIPALLGLGAAVALLGLGLGAAGAGIFLLAAGLTALGVSGAAGAVGITVIFSAILNLIPLALKKLGEGIVALAGVIQQGAPAIVGALVAVLKSLLSAINTLAPLIVSTLVHLVILLANALVANVPKLVVAGYKLITGVLNGVASHIGAVVDAGVKAVVAFVNGVANNLGRIANAGANLVVKFVNSIASAISSHSAALRAAGFNLAYAIIDGMSGGLLSKVGSVVSAAASMGAQAIEAVRRAIDSHSPSKEFYKLGQYATQGFANGIHDGTKADVQKALTDLSNMLKDTIQSTSKDIDSAQKKLNTLLAAKKPNAANISAARKALAQAKKEHTESVNAYNDLTNSMKSQSSALTTLAAKNDTLTSKIADATSKLTDAKKARDDYTASITDQYDKLGTIDSTTHLSDFEADTKKQIDDTLAYTDKLASLRKLGLSDKVYTQLLQSGTAASPLVTELLAQGKTGVDTLNSLGAQLETAATSLGTQASTQLYQAAVDSAQGLVDGLAKQQAALEKQMDTIADAMVNSIKKKLGIHSPSKEFAKLGGFTIDGLALGLGKTTQVEQAATNVGETAIYHLKKSISGISSAVATEMDFNPTIKPVLDLTSVKKDASTLGGLLSAAPLNVSGTFNLAASASAGYQANKDLTTASTSASGATASTPNALVFNQYNTSPKALSSGEIYRQTKNQISVAKGALSK